MTGLDTNRKRPVLVALASLLILGFAARDLTAAEPVAATVQEAAETSRAHLPEDTPWTFASVLRGLMGLATLVGIAWAISLDRRRFPWRIVLGGIGMQVVLGWMLIRARIGYGFFEAISAGITRLLQFSNEGAVFVFGSFVTDGSKNGPGLAFTALPTIIFFSCLMAVLYHLRVMHVLIWLIAQVMNRILGVTGAESMAMGANIFVGQTEAPLVIRRFIPRMTKSELMSLMTGGFATIAGSVLAAYIHFLRDAGGADLVPHLLIASVMSAPAAFAISKIIVPETEVSETGGGMSLRFEKSADNVLDAAATGTVEGWKLWINVFAMLLAFIAMVKLVDWPLEALGDRIALELQRAGGGLPFAVELSLARVFGFCFAPLAYLMGVEWHDASRFGALLGMKVCVNEFVAFLDLGREVALVAEGDGDAMHRRSLFMATYALCGFANFSSIGIQIGGIAPLAPERRPEIISLALRAMIGGALASWMTASIAGMFF
ncbi:MAG: nucleoside transporter C-terminal domain-containing protein [Planctomycetota bacterium]